MADTGEPMGHSEKTQNFGHRRKRKRGQAWDKHKRKRTKTYISTFENSPTTSKLSMNRSSNITHDHTYHFTKQEESIDSNSNNIEEQTGRPDTNNITDDIMENINHLLPTVLETTRYSQQHKCGIAMKQ